MSDLENNDPSRRWPSVVWMKFKDTKDADNQSIWLTAGLVSCFCLSMICVTQSWGHIFFAAFAVLTITFYFSLGDTSRKRILSCCMVVGFGISLIRMSQRPVYMEYCKIQKIRLPVGFNNSSTGSELALHVCVTHSYSFATPPKTNTSDPVSTLYLVPSKMLSKLYKSPWSQLSSYLQNPEIVTSWKDFIEKRLGQWMDGFYNQDLTREASQGEMGDTLGLKSTTQDSVQLGKVNPAGDASDKNAG